MAITAMCAVTHFGEVKSLEELKEKYDISGFVYMFTNEGLVVGKKAVKNWLMTEVRTKSQTMADYH